MSQVEELIRIAEEREVYLLNRLVDKAEELGMYKMRVREFEDKEEAIAIMELHREMENTKPKRKYVRSGKYAKRGTK